VGKQSHGCFESLKQRKKRKKKKREKRMKKTGGRRVMTIWAQQRVAMKMESWGVGAGGTAFLRW
jgi:hypothetical protein